MIVGSTYIVPTRCPITQKLDKIFIVRIKLVVHFLCGKASGFISSLYVMTNVIPRKPTLFCNLHFFVKNATYISMIPIEGLLNFFITVQERK